MGNMSGTNIFLFQHHDKTIISVLFIFSSPEVNLEVRFTSCQFRPWRDSLAWHSGRKFLFGDPIILGYVDYIRVAKAIRLYRLNIANTILAIDVIEGVSLSSDVDL